MLYKIASLKSVNIQVGYFFLSLLCRSLKRWWQWHESLKNTRQKIYIDVYILIGSIFLRNIQKKAYFRQCSWHCLKTLRVCKSKHRLLIALFHWRCKSAAIRQSSTFDKVCGCRIYKNLLATQHICCAVSNPALYKIDAANTVYFQKKYIVIYWKTVSIYLSASLKLRYRFLEDAP